MKEEKVLDKLGLLTLLISCFLMLLLGGCSGKEKASSKATNDKEKIKVGFSMGTLMEDRWLRDRDIFLAKAGQDDIEVIVNNANKDSDLQYQQVLEMLEQDIDVLVIAPNNSESEKKCVDAAKEKDVPVISYDRLVYNSNVDVYISFDNTDVGRQMAQCVYEQVPEGNYLFVNGAKTDHNSLMVYDGYLEVLQPHIDSGDINILGLTWVEGWTREKAFEFASERIKEYGDQIDAILCGNDSLAWGVIDALSEAQITKNVLVVGQDADLVACQRIAKGTQTLTIYKPIRDLVSKTVEICKQLAKGEDIKGQDTIFDGTYNVPYVRINVVGVTKDNLDETVIKDGFHLKEDVYQTKEDIVIE